MPIGKSKAKRKLRMCIELHAIHSFPPSNLNRDEAGHPKQAIFGGVRRARISSQAQKYVVRHSDVFDDILTAPLGIRTKRLVDHIVERLARDGIDEDWTALWAEETLTALYGKGVVKSEKKNSAPLFISEDEAQSIDRFLADAYANNSEPDIQAFCKEQLKLLKNRTSAPDIGLWGRMLAGKPILNIEAACRFAHAISTHEVSIPQTDVYSTGDDLSPAENSGAAMIGETYFNSASYYRNCILDWGTLVTNFGGDTDLARQTIWGCMAAFALVVPKGKQNSFVNQHRPAFLMAVARPDNNGISLANAFEQPLCASNGSGYIGPSIMALGQFWDEDETGYDLYPPTVAVLNPHGFDLHSKVLAGAQVQNLSTWIEVIIDLLGEV